MAAAPQIATMLEREAIVRGISVVWNYQDVYNAVQRKQASARGRVCARPGPAQGVLCVARSGDLQSLFDIPPLVRVYISSLSHTPALPRAPVQYSNHPYADDYW